MANSPSVLSWTSRVGATVAGARENLKEALELFFETASATEIQHRLHGEVYVTKVEIAVG